MCGLHLQMGWIILLLTSLLVLCVSYCAADPYVRQLKGAQHVRPHKIFRRSNPQRFHSNENSLSNFEIRKNTIIRTQDSRAMGAEYLSEMQKPTNEACLVWCLEYPRCNVAVFEEKNNCSCYLFDCGTMSDFRCNFTNYTYYISSILRGTHHPLDLKQWQSQAKHENDLTNLRKMPQPTPSSEYLDQSTILPSPLSAKIMDDSLTENRPPSQRESTEEQAQVAKWTPKPACLHYQFQCRSNKECIAIYNVCDGIPQCPDASDEGKDLHCPSEDSITTPSPTILPPTHPPPPTTLLTEPPRLSPVVPQSLAKATHNLEPSYPQNRPDDIPIVDDNTGTMYSLQDSNKGDMAWRQYQQQALANAQQDDYVAPVKAQQPSHSGYGPQHALFPNKHSSFHPASSTNYKSSSYQNSNANNNQWNNDYYNNDNYDPPRASPAESEYSGTYDAGYRNQGNSNNNFHMGSLKVGVNKPQPFDHYRPVNPYWTNDDQIPSKTGYSKSEGDLPPVPEISHQPNPNHLSRYNEPRPGQQSYRHQQQQQQQPLLPPSSYNLQNSQYPSSVDNIPSYQSLRPASETNIKNRRPVVQPQVQSEGGQDDDIYDPQAEVPRETAVEVDRRPQQPEAPITTSTIIQTMSFSTVLPTTSTWKPHVAKPQTAHAQIHSVSHSHVSPVSADSGMSISELQQASRVHAHESNGAVLALTLGLCITAILMVLVACRLRNLRRRLARRGGRSSLAHDADYLVNGMYL